MQKGTLVRLSKGVLPYTTAAHGALWVATGEAGYVGTTYFKSLATGAEKAFYDYYVTTEIDDG